MRHSWRALYFQLGGVLLAIGCIFWFSRVLPVANFVATLQQDITYWGFWSALCYPLLFAGCNLLLLPGGVLSIGSGFFFGLWWGFFLILIGNVAGAAVAFFLARSAGQYWLSERLRRNPRLKALEPAVRRKGWKIVFLSQLHPLFPTSVLNYL